MASASRTSETHPLHIAWVQPEGLAGALGLTLCPGKYQPYALTGAWHRDLDTDLQAIVASAATVLISLMEDHEYEELQVTELASKACALGLIHYRLAIPDAGVPDAGFESRWSTVGRDIRARLQSGEALVIHCKGGLGRTGMIGARLLVELGAQPDEAIAKVRAARPGAIETRAQERHVRTCAAVAD